MSHLAIINLALIAILAMVSYRWSLPYLAAALGVKGVELAKPFIVELGEKWFNDMLPKNREPGLFEIGIALIVAVFCMFALMGAIFRFAWYIAIGIIALVLMTIAFASLAGYMITGLLLVSATLLGIANIFMIQLAVSSSKWTEQALVALEIEAGEKPKRQIS